MKKLITTLLLLAAISFYSQAQWVSIPDTNFGTWLNTNGYGTCMTGNNSFGWYMDTTCAAVVNEDTLGFNQSPIKDFTGIQYFDNLRALYWVVTQITVSPPLPASLKYFVCAANYNLTSLPPLPAGLSFLDCEGNNLTSLPSLPSGITKLLCQANKLTSLPSLPPNLVYLRCDNNRGLHTLPALPNSIQYLDCSADSISNISALPDSLTECIVLDNQLTSLPALPQRLTELWCLRNQLTTLPELPSSLTLLECYENQLTSLPALPNSLTILECNSNQLTSIPELPDSLYGLTISGNPLTCLPRIKRIVNFDFRVTNISCLSNYGNVTVSYPPLDSLPLCQPGNVNGCVVDSNCTTSCVWPGDADYNFIADNNDLLPIGLAYGTSGIRRPQNDIYWYAHPSTNWTDTLPSGTNYKHIDCNGDSIINANDTTAIIQNFGLTHAKTDDATGGWRMTDPGLYITLSPDTTHAGDTMYADITLGDSLIPATNIYGLAFTLNYDASVVDSSKTTITFGNSWLGTDTDKIWIAKDFPSSGQLKCAITRIDHTPRSGHGPIGRASFVITTDNINGKNLAYYQANTWVSDLRVIDNLANAITVNQGRDSSLVEFEQTTLDNGQLAVGNFRIHPNPAKDEVQVTVTDELVGGELRLCDINGTLITKRIVQTSNLKLQTSNLSAGVYFVQVVSGKGLLTKRLVIGR